MCSIPKQTLWEILSGPECLDIRIPRIQRDYAHGRDEKAAIEVRTTLITELIGALRNETPQNDSKQVDLGLIFGAADEDEMTLYDGQQRFTTLFLLHWCLAWMARDTSVAEDLQRFSYNSRLHSRDFCRALTSKGLKLEPNNTKPSLRFLDATWFCPIWRTDPTVAGMLVVLDLMYDRLPKGQQEAAELWGRLKSGQAPCFSWLKLKKEDSNEDLYVKLNSRGRTLTEFEKLKAWLEQQVEDNESLKAIARLNAWKLKLDNQWLDLFWKESDTVHDRTTVMDRAILTFFLGNALNLVIATGDGIDDTLIQRVHDRSFLTRDDWGRIFTPDSLPRLLKNLDILVHSDIRERIDQWAKDGNLLLFSDKQEIRELHLTRAWISGWTRPTYTDRFLFFGLLRFLIENPPGSSGWNEFAFHRWMRLVRNLGENSNIASNTLRNTIQSIQVIAPHGLQNLDEWMSKQKIDTVPIGLHKDQWLDEIEKAKLRLAQNCEDTAATLDAAEDQPFLRGQIGFLIVLATSNVGFDLQRFQTYAATMDRYFSEKNGPKNDIRVLLQQALLSIGDYTGGGGRKCLGSTQDDWRNIFRIERAKYEIHRVDEETPQSIFKAFLDLDLQDEGDLQALVETKLPNLCWSDWRKWMLASKHPLEFCRSSCFDVDEAGGTVVLIKGRDYRSEVVELRTYYLSKVLKENLKSQDWHYEWRPKTSCVYRANDRVRLELLDVAAVGFALRILINDNDNILPPGFSPPPEAFNLRDDEITSGWNNCGLRYLEWPYTPEIVAKGSQDEWQNLVNWSPHVEASIELTPTL